MFDQSTKILLKDSQGKDYSFACTTSLKNWTSVLDNHFKGSNWKNPYNNQYYATSECTVRDGKVMGDIGMTCIWRDDNKKIIIIGSNINLGKVLINTINLEDL